jgi:hypothetical protein
MLSIIFCNSILLGYLYVVYYPRFPPEGGKIISWAVTYQGPLKQMDMFRVPYRLLLDTIWFCTCYSCFLYSAEQNSSHELSVNKN